VSRAHVASAIPETATKPSGARSAIWHEALEDETMAAINSEPAGDGGRKAARIVMWSSGLIVLTLLALLANVGLAALLGRLGRTTDWPRLSAVGQTFGVLSSIIGGLTLTVVVMTSRLQVRDLHRQLESSIQSHSELRRTAEADRGRLHLEILKLAMDDPQLAEVWPPFEPGLSVKENRQYLYANIIYQVQLTSMRVGGHSDEEVLDAMRYLFTSPIMRDYWKAAARARASLVPATEEYLLAQKVDALWHEYEAVVAARRDPARGSVKDFRFPDQRSDAHDPPDGPGKPEAA
jgi:hypothetical protein